MKFKLFLLLLCSSMFLKSFGKQIEKVSINLIETSDVHGSFFPYNFTSLSNANGSLARVSSFVKKQRKKFNDNCILVDNGDILQGQPTVYYYNYIDTVSQHVTSQIMNYMRYDVGNIGNHDIETGHSVYDKWISECNFPMLGANIIDKKSNSPYLKPYQVFNKSGVKIAVLGMTSPAIPFWLPENLWEGLYFEDMEECARKWIGIIKEKENPDVIVGLFHSGSNGNILNNIVENASQNVAKNVPGFDVVLCGHDHVVDCRKIVNVNGETVLIANPGSRAKNVVSVTMDFVLKDKKVVEKRVDGKVINLNSYAVDKDFMSKFSEQYNVIKNFVSQKIGSISSSVSSHDAFFGPSGFLSIIHDLQLKVSGAEISFAAPLSYDSKINKGDILISDMFKLYSYENMLYVMKLSGKEIKDFLEYSYSKWINTVDSDNDNLFIIEKKGDRYSFINPTFNFDSAAGINYVVDITKPVGSRVTIESMSNGKPFDLNATYKVAINSYRGNGGGGLLTNGSGIAKEDLPKRIIRATDRDLRYYLINYILEQKELQVPEFKNWRFIPEELYNKVSTKERSLIFK